MRDRDGWYILNIFTLCDTFDDVTFKINLLEMLTKFKENDHIKAKIMWMINYFNSWFTKYEYRLLNQQKITGEEIEFALK